MATDLVTSYQICDKETKNLGPEQIVQQVPERRIDIAGKLVEYSWKMQKEGYDKETIRGNSGCLRALVLRGADLADPESVKEILSKELRWSQNRKRNVINAYTLLLKFADKTWNKPKCLVTAKFPFIPSEKEIDDFIAASGKKNATFLQVLKETAMRSGEAKRLKWLDIDCERNIITLNEPEKNSNPRMWKVSATLIEMINTLPKKNEQLFTGSLKSMKTTFSKTHKRLSINLQNPRLMKIHFHTFRHWKATMLYHYKPDMLEVAEFIGHKDLENTRLYIQLEKSLFKNLPNDQFLTRVAHNTDEACKLIDVGFEFITGEYNDGGKIFRKRK